METKGFIRTLSKKQTDERGNDDVLMLSPPPFYLRFYSQKHYNFFIMIKIPVSKMFLGKEEAAAAAEVIKKGHISGTYGKELGEFENKFANYCGCKYGVAASNGTVALHLAMAVLGIKKGDEVLVSSLTNMATFFAVLYQGARPIPVDVELDTLNISPDLIEKKITPRTKAIMVVHLYGHPVNMDPILKIAKKHKLFVVEDAAEAHGAEYKKRKIGSLSDIACFSFYANKILTTGEGGMLTTNNKKFAERARLLGSLAYGKKNRFMHEDVGFNYRMTNVQAAIGLAQFKKINQVIAKKRAMVKAYINGLKTIKDIQLPVEKSYAKNVYWMFNIVLKGKLKNKRDFLMKKLKEKGIETRESFMPYNLQKSEIKGKFVKKGDCPVANEVSKSGLYLPSGPDITKREIDYVVSCVKEILS